MAVLSETQVAIIGAGPSGLLLARLLDQRGIRNVVIESKSRSHVEGRVRAGLLEPKTVALLTDADAGERLRREAMQHSSVAFVHRSALRKIDLRALTGESVTIYGQQEIVKDLIARRYATDGDIYFCAEDVRIRNITGHNPSVTFRLSGVDQEINCDFIAGCDGFHGPSRRVIAEHLTIYDHTYRFGWLGILAKSPPLMSEVLYAPDDRGLALFSMRSPSVSRLYLETRVEEVWGDCQLWEELRLRLQAYGSELIEGEILEKRVFPLRRFVADPMQLGRLFLVGDAAHIVPPSAAKGLNMAIADSSELAEALAQFFHLHNETGLKNYTAKAMPRIWESQRFSEWMTRLLHRSVNPLPYDRRLQEAELDRLLDSPPSTRLFAGAYVGDIPRARSAATSHFSNKVQTASFS